MCEPSRPPSLEMMEKMLKCWIVEQVDECKSNINSVAIEEKVLSFHPVTPTFGRGQQYMYTHSKFSLVRIHGTTESLFINFFYFMKIP